MEVYSAVRKMNTHKWVGLENIIMNEVTQTQKERWHVFSLKLEPYC